MVLSFDQHKSNLDMEIWALLGATGATGSSVLRCLLDENFGCARSVQINILVRSRAKLLALFPEIDKDESISRRVEVIVGNSTDDTAVMNCVRGASVVFSCVGQNDSGFGITLYSATASALVKSLKTLRRQKLQDHSEHSSPTIIQLRSASLNTVLARQAPWPVRKLVHFCLYYSYNDLKRAVKLLTSAALEADKDGSPLLHYIFVDPPTLHDAQGTTRTGYRLIKTETQQTALSYADLGAAMCEIAERALDGELRDEPVGVTATGHVNTDWGILARHLLHGAFGRLGGALAAMFPVPMNI